MFDTGRRVLFCDYFRIPSRVVPAPAPHPPSSPLTGAAWLQWRDEKTTGSVVSWVDATTQLGTRRPGHYRIGPLEVFADLLDDTAVRAALAADGRAWHAATTILATDGSAAGVVWEDAGGNVFLPFDPAEVMHNFWSERYQTMHGGTALTRARAAVRTAYYLLRPVLPRAVQIGARRAFSRLQSRARFPRWPVEPALHDFYDWLLALLADSAGVPVPYIAPWPGGCSWALVLTHDVETRLGYDHLHELRDVETQLGYRSCWNFVPKQYEVDQALVDDLVTNGFEVGVHGLWHDGRDLSPSQLPERRPLMRAYAESWRAVGFRSPATLRRWDVMPTLGFTYDSSYPDTDPYEPQPGGCCSWLPFENAGLIELPITLPQDHTLLVILRSPDGQAWTDKAEYLRSRGGLALLVTHPDYLQPDSYLDTYRDLLERFRDDATAWRALPREVAAWWRARSETIPRLEDGTWQPVGPAAHEARIAYALPAAPRTSSGADRAVLR